MSDRDHFVRVADVFTWHIRSGANVEDGCLVALCGRQPSHLGWDISTPVRAMTWPERVCPRCAKAFHGREVTA